MKELEELCRNREAELEVALRNGDTRQVAELLGLLGSNLEAIGQRVRGVGCLRWSVALFEHLGDQRGLAENLARLACALADDPDEARALLDRASRIARDAGHRSEEATSLNNLAVMDEREGSLDAARARYQRSLELLRSLDEPSKLASTLNNLGVLLDKKGEEIAARAAWREAMSLAEAIEDSGTWLISRLRGRRTRQHAQQRGRLLEGAR